MLRVSIRTGKCICTSFRVQGLYFVQEGRDRLFFLGNQGLFVFVVVAEPKKTESATPFVVLLVLVALVGMPLAEEVPAKRGGNWRK